MTVRNRVFATLVVALFIGALGQQSSAMAEDYDSYPWVQISRPMLACEYAGEGKEDEADARLQDSIAQWISYGAVSQGCYVFKPGDRYQVDKQQPGDALKLLAVCHGCVPFITVYFLPKQDRIGRYMFDVRPPRGKTDLPRLAR